MSTLGRYLCKDIDIKPIYGWTAVNSIAVRQVKALCRHVEGGHNANIPSLMDGPLHVNNYTLSKNSDDTTNSLEDNTQKIRPR